MKRFWIFASLLALVSLLAGVGFLGAAEPPDIPLGDPARPGIAAPIPESVRSLGTDPVAAPAWSPIEYSQVVAAQPVPPTVEMELQVWLVNLAVRHPWLGVLLLLVACARLGLKPLMAAAHRYVESTAGPEDDEALARFEASPAFRWLSFALDVLGSVKLTTVLLLISRFRSRGTAEGGRALALAGLAAIFFLGGTGCMTTGGGQGLTPDRVQRITRTAVFGTATVWTIKKPESKPAFEAALRGIDALVAEERWDTVALASALTGTGVDTFTSDEARLIIAGTTLAMETLAGSEVDLANVQYARAVILGAQAGLRQALGATATPAAN